MKSNTIFSIITVNFNNATGLKLTIDSVRKTLTSNAEFIVIDGGSTDGSIEAIQENCDIISYWTSEKDSGPYDAMNKGVRVANGEYCIFMNSGDTFASDDVLKRTADKIGADLICGNANIVGSVNYLWTAPETLNTDFWLSRFSICHQAVFIKTHLLKDLPYDISFKIAADYYFFAYITIVKHATYQKLDFVVCNYDSTGMSSNDADSGAEKIKALDKLRFLNFLPEDDLIKLCKQLKYGSRKYNLARFVLKLISSWKR